MGSSILNIGISGLNAARYGIQTTSHNISNSNTPGYSRQSIDQSSSLPQFAGMGYVGTGVNIDNIRRNYDGFLNLQVQQAQNQVSYLQSYYSHVSQIDNLLADATAGLTPAMADFFAGIQDMAARPSDVSARQSALSSAEALAGRLNTLDARLNELRSSANAQLASTVTGVNALSSQIATLNQRIALATAAGQTSYQPNDLLDQREALVLELNKEVRVTTVDAGDGTINVFMGNGQSLVVGNRSYNLSTTTDTFDPQTLNVTLETGGSPIVMRAADLANGGKLGGVLAFRENSLDPAQDALGRIATVLGSAINLQHTAGRDLSGAVGGALFTLGSPQVFSNSANAGSGVVTATVTDANDLTGNNYRITYDGTNYIVTNLSTNVAQTFGSLPQTIDGLQFAISGSASANDSFLIQPTRLGARNLDVAISDVNKLAAASPNITNTVGGANTGTASVVSSSVAIPASSGFDYSTSVQIRFTSATAYQLRTGAPGFATVAATGTLGANGQITYNGWTTTLTGTPATSDTFTISFSASGSGDNRNAVALGGLQTTKLVEGTSSLQEAYGEIVSQVGNKTREVEVNQRAQETLLEQNVAAQQSVAGVNLDEEAANLMRYQQAYSAAGRVIAMANDLFRELIEATRS